MTEWEKALKDITLLSLLLRNPLISPKVTWLQECRALYICVWIVAGEREGIPLSFLLFNIIHPKSPGVKAARGAKLMGDLTSFIGVAQVSAASLHLPFNSQAVLGLHQVFLTATCCLRYFTAFTGSEADNFFCPPWTYLSRQQLPSSPGGPS